MNLGYSKSDNNPIHNENCPICGKNIYVSKYYNDYACEDFNCLLGHGAIVLIDKVQRLLDMLSIKKEPIKLSKIDYSSTFVKIIDGEHFKCACGCDLFHHEYDDDSIYTCNCCKNEYKGE